MGKKRNKIDFTPIVWNIKEYHVMANSGNGYQHEYTIKEWDTVDGTVYCIEYAWSDAWSEELQGVVITRVLNDGNSYIFDEDIPSNMGYDNMFIYSALFNFITNREASGNFNYKILETSVMFESKF